jgi:hypothetical protein
MPLRLEGLLTHNLIHRIGGLLHETVTFGSRIAKSAHFQPPDRNGSCTSAAIAQYFNQSERLLD